MKQTIKPIEQHPHNLCRGKIEGAKDSFSAIDKALAAFRVGETFTVEDGFIGLDVRLTVYNDPSVLRTELPVTGRLDDDREPANSNYPPNTRAVCLYLIHTALPRIGRAEDADIIRDILSRGIAVCVVDYCHDVRADVPDLDWSVQNLILRMGDGKIPLGIPTFPHTFHSLPAGYTIRLGIPYYNYRENGVEGIEEHIVDIWNKSLSRMSGRFAKGNVFRVKWGQKTDEDGKALFDAEGNPIYKKVREGAEWIDEQQRILPVGYTIAEDIRDCVRTDGSAIDLNLYIDLIYPVNPERPVPVFAHHSSAEERHQPQPIYHGFAMRSYALANFEHAYTPMARRTHFGYFEGEISEGRRADFTLRFLTGMTQMSAAIRIIRKLAELYPDEYRFDTQRIGCYGASKGAPTNILGTAHPELLAPEQFLPGRRGENNNPQPNETYEDGTPIPSNIQFAYTSNGGGGSFLFKDQCPVCVTRGEADGLFVSSSHMGLMLSSLRANDTPVLDMTMPGVGHKVIHGYSTARDYDMYNALFTYADYYLKEKASECLYILPTDKSQGVMPNAPIRLKFSGEHTREEILLGTRIVHEDGTPIRFRLNAHFRGNEWTFVPLDLRAGERVSVEVLPTLLDKRQKPVGVCRRSVFTVCGSAQSKPKNTQSDGSEKYFRFDIENNKNCTLLFASDNETAKGARYLITSPSAPGSVYFAAPTDAVARVDLPNEWIKGGELTVRIAPKKPRCAPIKSFSLTDPSEKNPFVSPVGGYAEPVRILPMGEIREAYHGDSCLVAPTGFRLYLDDVIPIQSRRDIGRSFRIRFEARCQNDRMLQARVIERLGSEEYIDLYNDAALLEPMYADRWSGYAFEYTVSSEDNTKREHRKSSILLLASSNGIKEEEFCIRNLVIEEIAESADVDDDSVRIVFDAR